MRKLTTAGIAAIVAASIVAIGGTDPLFAQDKAKQDKERKGNPPKFIIGHDFQIRQGGKADFDKDTPKIGVEIYLHEETNAFVAISDVGALAVAPAAPVGMDKTCKWLTGHDMSARKAGEKDFTQKTKRFGFELYRDMATNRLLYVCETGSIALAPIPATLVTDKGPKWDHAFELKVRGINQSSFDNARKVGLEIYRDDNTSDLIYLSETGGIATSLAPASPSDPKTKNLPPKSAYGLELRVRAASELNWTEKTKKVGVEIYEDPYADNQLFYFTENGYVATAPNTGKFADLKNVTWKTAMVLRARKTGEKSFESATPFGVEVFIDNRTGNTIFISETGSIAVLPKQ